MEPELLLEGGSGSSLVVEVEADGPKNFSTWADAHRKKSVRLGWEEWCWFGDRQITVENGERLEEEYLAALERGCREAAARLISQGMSSGQATREYWREVCRQDLYFLVKYVLGYSDLVFHFHYPLCMSAQTTGPWFKGLWELPRGHFKTTCLTIGGSVQRVLRDPEAAVLFMSNAEANAKSKMDEARSHFLYTERLLEYFPEHKPSKASERGNSEMWTTPARRRGRAESTFEVAGVDTRKTGKHYDIIYADDFWDEVSVTSPGVAQRCADKLDAIKFLLRGAGEIHVVGTRWAFDDPTQLLLDDESFRCTIVSAVCPDGSALFPEFKPLSILYYEWRANPYNFSCQMMLNPTLEDRSFKSEWFRYVKISEVLKAEAEGKLTTVRRILTDAQSSGATSRDWSVAIVLVIDSLGRYTIAEYYREKCLPNEFIDVGFALADKWNAQFVACQKAALETALQSFIDAKRRERMDKGERSVGWPQISLAKSGKLDRMQALQPYFAKQQIYFAEEAMGEIKELEQEILSFPLNQSADDGMDALSMLTDPMINRLPQPPTPVAGPREQDPLKPISNRDDALEMEKDWRQERQREYLKSLTEEEESVLW